MKKALILLMVMTSQSVLIAHASERSFAGTIGRTLKIIMTLKIEGEQVSGAYFYEQYKKPIALKGTIDAQKNILLSELDRKGNVSGIFKGKLVAETKIEGTWSRPDGSNQEAFSVEEKHEPASAVGDWVGSWTLVGSTIQDNAKLVISDVTSESFQFELNTQSGGHLDEFAGTVSIMGNQAVYKDTDRGCTLTFVLKEKTLTLNKSDDCSLAMGCRIEGDYRTDLICDTPTLEDLGVFETEAQEEIFLKLVGNDSSTFSFSMQLIAEEKDLDHFGARVREGFVRGLATEMTAIVMINPEGKIWAAARDNDEVRYFTNAPAYLGKLPKTIERWRERFPEVKVVYVSAEASKKKNL